MDYSALFKVFEPWIYMDSSTLFKVFELHRYLWTFKVLEPKISMDSSALFKVFEREQGIKTEMTKQTVPLQIMFSDVKHCEIVC
jgi:hypothetical protein